MLYLEAPRFESVALICVFDLRVDLISALVERWRLKTHTFHLPCGKCSITLEYVALQLEFPIDCSAITSTSKVFKPTVLCYHLLGRLPGDAGDKFTTLRFSWLKEIFEYLSSSATKQEMMYTG